MPVRAASQQRQGHGPPGQWEGLAGMWARAHRGHLSSVALLLDGQVHGEGVTPDGELGAGAD